MKSTRILSLTGKCKTNIFSIIFQDNLSIKAIAAILIISCSTLLSSCVVAVRTPRYDTNGVIIERHVHGRHHYHGEQDNHGDRHDHDRR